MKTIGKQDINSGKQKSENCLIMIEFIYYFSSCSLILWIFGTKKEKTLYVFNTNCAINLELSLLESRKIEKYFKSFFICLFSVLVKIQDIMEPLEVP